MVAFSNFLPWVELFAKKSSLFGCFRQSPTKTKPLLQNPGPRMHQKIVSLKLCERWNLHWHQGFKCSLLLFISGKFDLFLKLPANLPTMIELNTHMVNQIFFVAPRSVGPMELRINVCGQMNKMFADLESHERRRIHTPEVCPLKMMVEIWSFEDAYPSVSSCQTLEVHFAVMSWCLFLFFCLSNAVMDSAQQWATQPLSPCAQSVRIVTLVSIPRRFQFQPLEPRQWWPHEHQQKTGKQSRGIF